MARRLRPPKKSRPTARGFANDLRNMAPDIRKAAGEALREATRLIIKELQEEGPAYSGKFKTKWYSQVEGRGNKVFAAVGVPRFTDKELKRGAPTILIGNTSPYAQEAMDLVPGRFIRQEEGPVKTPVAVGVRFGRMRGQVKEQSTDEIIDSGKRPAVSTAQLDWYSTYMEGGRFGKAFKQGARSGFIRPVNKP
jgi:hypothetical protein